MGPRLLKKLPTDYVLDIDDARPGRLAASSKLEWWAPLAIVLFGSGLCVGFLVLWKGVTTKSPAMAIGGALLGGIGLVVLLFGVALLSYSARLSVSDAGIVFERTYFWLMRRTSLERHALRWVTCGIAWQRGGRMADTGNLRVCLHFEERLGDVAVHTVDLDFGRGGVRNYAAALDEVLRKADEIARALGIEHRANWWEGKEGAAWATVLGIGRRGESGGRS